MNQNRPQELKELLNPLQTIREIAPKLNARETAELIKFLVIQFNNKISKDYQDYLNSPLDPRD